jgi:hypothetical protein
MAMSDTTKYVPLSTPRKSLTGTSDIVDKEPVSIYSVSNINEMLRIRNNTYEELLHELDKYVNSLSEEYSSESCENNVENNKALLGSLPLLFYRAEYFENLNDMFKTILNKLKGLV